MKPNQAQAGTAWVAFDGLTHEPLRQIEIHDVQTGAVEACHMTSRGHYECVNPDCKPQYETDDAFYVAPCCLMEEAELGILVSRDGIVQDIWTDGTRGVNRDLREMAQDHIDGGCPPHCVFCNEEAEWKRS